MWMMSGNGEGCTDKVTGPFGILRENKNSKFWWISSQKIPFLSINLFIPKDGNGIHRNAKTSLNFWWNNDKISGTYNDDKSFWLWANHYLILLNVDLGRNEKGNSERNENKSKTIAKNRKYESWVKNN